MTISSASLLRHRFDLSDNLVYLLEFLGALFFHRVLPRQDIWKEMSWAVALAAGNKSSYLVVFDLGRNRMTTWQPQRRPRRVRGYRSTLPLQDSSRREKDLDHPSRFDRLAFEMFQLHVYLERCYNRPCRHDDPDAAFKWHSKTTHSVISLEGSLHE